MYWEIKEFSINIWKGIVIGLKYQYFETLKAIMILKECTTIRNHMQINC